MLGGESLIQITSSRLRYGKTKVLDVNRLHIIAPLESQTPRDKLHQRLIIST